MNLFTSEFQGPSREPAQDVLSADNTFDLMPVHAISSAEAGDTLWVNLATYTGPRSREVAASLHSAPKVEPRPQPRWIQGVELTVGGIDLVDNLLPYEYLTTKARCSTDDFRASDHLAGDRLFQGNVNLKGLEVPVLGLVHSQLPGWIKLEREGEPMRTIVDLKLHLGKISAAQAAQQNAVRQEWGSFDAPGGKPIRHGLKVGFQ